jgi:hypothetical protein
MPAGQEMVFSFGRLWVLKDGVVYFSEPYRINAINPYKGFLSLDGPIRVWAPISSGMVVGTDSEVAILPGGDPNQFELKRIAEYGVVQGTAVSDFVGGIFVMSERGMLHITAAGELVNMQDGTVAVDTAEQGSSCIISEDGLSKVVTSLHNSELSTTAATSFMDAEIIRKENLA